MAYNFGNFLRTLATPEPIEDWSMTTREADQDGAKVVSPGRYVAFQWPRLYSEKLVRRHILRLIAELPPLIPRQREAFGCHVSKN